MTHIGLIRHGITDWNYLGKAQGVSNIPLNDEGIRQANMLSNRLSKEEWDLIISSDLLRAKETAEILAGKMNVPIHSFDKRIREINCGRIEGTTEEERVIRWGKNWRDLDLGMERFELVAKRGIDFIEEIANLHKGKKVLVVSHGALIGLTLQYLMPEKFPTTYIENTSITILQKSKGEWDCKLYNCTQHLGNAHLV